MGGNLHQFSGTLQTCKWTCPSIYQAVTNPAQELNIGTPDLRQGYRVCQGLPKNQWRAI